MKKYSKWIVSSLLACILLFLTNNVPANALTGEIIDIFGENITTIQIEGEHRLKVGDTIDLTYMAGVLPMAIGVYETTTVQGNVVLCKPVSITMPPNKGMNVQIDILRGTASSLSKKKQNFPKPISLLGNTFQSDSQSQNIEIKGEVLDVMGDDIKVAVKDNGAPEIGWPVDLFYVTSQGKELPVGTWKVKSIEGQIITASKVKGIGKARKGLKAVMHNGQRQKMVVNNVSPGPGGVGSVGELFSGSGPGVFKDVRADQPHPAGLPVGSPFLDVVNSSPLMEKGGSFYLGDPNAKVVITVFAGFECPFSKKIYPKMLKVIKPHFKNVKYVLRHYPLPMYPNAKLAAKAVLAAGEQNRYWEMVDALLAEKNLLNKKKINALAKRLGLNVDQFSNDLYSKDVKWEQIIRADMALAKKWNLRGTPSYFINGKGIKHSDVAEFKREINGAVMIGKFSKGSPGEKFIRQDPLQWKEVTFDRYKEELVDAQSSLQYQIGMGVEQAGLDRSYFLGVKIAKNEHVIGQASAAGPMGVRVLAVFSKSPAQKAGIEVADIIYEANGINVTDVPPFMKIVDNSPGGKLRLKIQRNGRIIEKTIKLKKVKH